MLMTDMVRKGRLALLLAFALVAVAAIAAEAGQISRFLPSLSPADLMEGATGFGTPRDDVPVVPILKGSEVAGYVFLTSDFVGTTGYSGKPIHIVAAVSGDAVITGAVLAEHSEPIVLVGIPESKMRALIGRYAGLDLKTEVAAGGSGHDLDIISGATVTVMVIDDTIVRAGIIVSRSLGLGGLAPEARATGPTFEIVQEAGEARDWSALAGDGSIRSLNIDVGQVNAAFEATGDKRAIARPEKGQPADTFIDMRAALVSIPAIGLNLLGPQEFANLEKWLEPGEQAILVMGRGRYSYKGSGYVRGGIFDRIHLIQGDASVRFRDRQHRRLGSVAAAGAPSFSEVDLFRIPADAGFDPTQPWRLQLLVQRQIGAIEKSFLTFDLDYRPPEKYLRQIAPGRSAAPVTDVAKEAAAKAALWKRIWRDKTPEIVALLAMLGTLTAAFFFQMFVTRSERFVFWFRIGFLSMTLVYLGWYANAQLSVVNLMALGNSLATGFNWDAFLMDPLTFLLWFSVAAALLFWGRGAYCGWLCPFGALQELLNRVAKLLHIPQWTLPWGLHERLWAVKYLIFLGLFALSLVSLPMAERFAEVEPFKTAIILKFDRAWPFVTFAAALLGAGLFIERFYCRYLCPLGAALAIPGRLRMFDWLKRYPECGRPCQTCANECFVQAIAPTGEIQPNECLYCLHCQVLYQSETKCPVVIKKTKSRERIMKSNIRNEEALDRVLKKQP
ncbi:MAG: NosR/NirI family protein [Notoacmeibacter sp.]|nr:NosR/NirI family protein [Notoacmeibacter sp.]